MDQSEQLAMKSSRAENGTPRKKSYYPLLAIGVALAFAANAWFFYRQGREEASTLDSESMPAAVVAWTRTEPSPVPMSAAQPDGAAATDTAQQPAAANETSKPAAGNTATADKPAAKRTLKPKPANRSMLAKAAKPANSNAMASSERNVALLSHPKPAYPVTALREHQQGTVLVLAQVDVSGHVSDVRIARHSGSNTLDRAAENEVRRWRFEPALHNGRPVVASVEVPVSYRLDQ